MKLFPLYYPHANLLAAMRSQTLWSKGLSRDCFVPSPHFGKESEPAEALFEAIKHQDLSTLKHLLQQFPQLIHEVNKLGQPPLICATSCVVWANAKIVKRLLASGANVNARDKDGNTALMSAVSLGNVKIIIELLASGADVNLQNNKGNTALMLASNTDNVEVVLQMLLRQGVNVNTKNKQNQRAITLALHNENLPLVDALLQVPHEPSPFTVIPPPEWSSKLYLFRQSNLDTLKELPPDERANLKRYLPKIESKTGLRPCTYEGQLPGPFLEFFQKLANTLPEKAGFVTWQFPQRPTSSTLEKHKDTNGKPRSFPHVHVIKLSKVNPEGKPYLLIEYQDNETMLQDLNVQESTVLNLKSGQYVQEKLNIYKNEHFSATGNHFYLMDFYNCFRASHANVPNGGNPKQKRLGPIIKSYKDGELIDIQELRKGLTLPQLEAMQSLLQAVGKENETQKAWLQKAFDVQHAVGAVDA